MLLDIMSYDLCCHVPTTCISRTDWTSIVTVLMEQSDCDEVVTVICEKTCCLIQRQTEQIVAECPELFSAIARVLGSSFFGVKIKGSILRTFHHVLDSVVAATTVLPRQPKVLGAIVTAAAAATLSEEEEDNVADNSIIINNNNMLLMAIAILLALASNVTNRRLMARQPGLLACLIRYTRNLPPTTLTTPPTPLVADAISSTIPDREVIKQRIVQIADAL